MNEGDYKGARGAAFRVLNRVASEAAYADILMEAELSGLDEIDRPLAMEIVYGVLRWQIKIDWIIGFFSSIRPAKLEHSVLNVLRIGVYQLFFLTRIPPFSAVNESVNLIKKEGRKKAGFVNAVLRAAIRDIEKVTYPGLKDDPIAHVSIVYSHPEWIVKRWTGRYGLDETIGLCKANQTIPPKTLRANTLVTSREGLIDELAGEGLEVKKTSFSPDGIEVLKGSLKAKDPRYYIQDEASQLIPYLLSPKEGELVLDACSAPGGKTTHIAQLMRNSGRILAIDRYPQRLKTVEEAAKRLKIDIIVMVAADSGSNIPVGHSGFDAILCDAPCSGLGVIRRSPDIKIHRKEEDIKTLSNRQGRLLKNLSGYLKKGGRMVYSTCTFEPEETEDIVRRFLDTHKDFVLENARGYLPEDCRVLTEPGFLRTYPHRHGMDGFFAARLKKV